MQIFVLERSNYDGNDLLIVSTDKNQIAETLKDDKQNYTDAGESPYYYISVWENGSCIKQYKGEDSESFIS